MTLETVKETTKSTVKPVDKKAEAKVNLKYLRDKDREMVRGKFIFHECPGGVLEFVFRAYKEDQIERYSLADGQVYSLPLGVARHLNKNCFIPQYSFIQGEKDLNIGVGFSGGNTMRITHKVRRCSFQSLEFVDIEDLSPAGIITPVEYIT